MAVWRRANERRRTVALLDYRNLCQKSGRPFCGDESDMPCAPDSVTDRVREICCEACGRIVKVRPDPGTRRFLVYPMHMRSEG